MSFHEVINPGARAIDSTALLGPGDCTLSNGAPGQLCLSR